MDVNVEVNGIEVQVAVEQTHLDVEVARNQIQVDILSGAAMGGGGGTASYFTDLLDCPADYTGEANKLVVVNPGEDGLTFVDPELLDCPVLIEPTPLTAQSAGDISMDMGVAKINIKWLIITCTSQSMKWNATLFTDDGFTNDAIQIVKDKYGDFAIYLDLPYQNKSTATDLYIRLALLSGSGTFSIRLLGMKMR